MDNIGKDELAKVIREHMYNKTIKKNKVKGVNLGPAVSVQPINVGEPINKNTRRTAYKPGFHQHLNDNQSRESHYFLLSQKQESHYFLTNKIKEPYFQNRKKIDGNHDCFFIFSQDKRIKI